MNKQKMFEEIFIQKFKRIGKKGVHFQKLTKVNYFVGENGSGKSSILEYIFAKYPNKSAFLRDSLSAIDFWYQIGYNKLCVYNTEGSWWKNVFEILLQKNVVILELIGYLILLQNNQKNKKELFFDKSLIQKSKKILKNLNIINFKQTNKIQNLDIAQIVGGENKLLNIVCAILVISKLTKAEIILIDEPETHLHPSLQKKLPDIFGFLSTLLNIQFFIATHSPFVVSTVGELTETENKEFNFPQKNNYTQKVYFLKDGQVADKHGLITHYGNKGYTGKNIGYIASKMLGIGLMDFISTQPRISTQDAPKLILCEGESTKQDAKIYNIIFRDMNPPVLFVSCRGNTQLHKTFRLLKEIKPGLSADFEVMMLRDRDHEFLSLADILKYKQENEGCKVLYKRAIECYLFSSETAKLVLAQFGIKLKKEDKEEMDNLQELIQISTEQGVVGDSYKSDLETLFNKITQGFVKSKALKGNNTAEKIAWLINPKTKTYKDLYKEIFE